MRWHTSPDSSSAGCRQVTRSTATLPWLGHLYTRHLPPWDLKARARLTAASSRGGSVARLARQRPRGRAAWSVQSSRVPGARAATRPMSPAPVACRETRTPADTRLAPETAVVT